MNLFKNNILEILDSTQSEREILNNHPLYLEIKNLDDVKIFMENHVFAVWDFMSIIKSLQKQLTCVETPWIPKSGSISSRLINQIVLDEETDLDPSGNYTSHFQLYLLGMAEAGANTAPINAFISQLGEGNSIDSSLDPDYVPLPAFKFVKHTFSKIVNAPDHILASAFTFGREEVIPDIFTSIIENISKTNKTSFKSFLYYLNRHINLDGETHVTMAYKMMKEVCGNDKSKWSESIQISKEMLTARSQFWDGIYDLILKNKTKS
tara:strand:- start:29309 stop:30103 length:795 start_codon:yes stop_codon:yes gene_type:complete